MGNSRKLIIPPHFREIFVFIFIFEICTCSEDCCLSRWDNFHCVPVNQFKFESLFFVVSNSLHEPLFETQWSWSVSVSYSPLPVLNTGYPAKFLVNRCVNIFESHLSLLQSYDIVLQYSISSQ